LTPFFGLTEDAKNTDFGLDFLNTLFHWEDQCKKIAFTSMRLVNHDLTGVILYNPVVDLSPDG